MVVSTMRDGEVGMTQTVEHKNRELTDLLPCAVKLARRLQALPAGAIYAIMLTKETVGEWKLVVLNEKGSKAEVLR